MTSPTSASPTEGERCIRILLADDHALLRDGMRALIERQRDMRVIAEAEDGQVAWTRARELHPDVTVLDLSMPRMGGAEAAERIAAECPAVRVLVLTIHEERGYLSRLLRAGAAGYVLKRSAGTELLSAIRTVAAGNTYVDPWLAGTLLTAEAQRLQRARPESSGPFASELTPRETEVLRLVAKGYSNKEIAGSLEIGVKTVETHKANAMTKLGLRNRAAVVRFAIEEGWLVGS